MLVNNSVLTFLDEASWSIIMQTYLKFVNELTMY